MKNIKLTIWAFWLSVIAIVMSFAVIALWLIKSSAVAVIQLDTFIGVIVALMALLVTIVLGWQIYNAVNIKEEIKSISSIRETQEQLKKQIELSRENIRQSNIHNAFYHSTMLGFSASIGKDYLSSYRFFSWALANSLQLDNPIEFNATIKTLSDCVSAISNGFVISDVHYKEIVEADMKIRSSKQYEMFQDEYERIYNVFLSKMQTPNKK